MRSTIYATATALLTSSAADAQFEFRVLPNEQGNFEAVSVADGGAVIGGRLNGVGAVWSQESGFQVIGGSYFRAISGDGHAALSSRGCFWVQGAGCVGDWWLWLGTDFYNISRDGNVIVGSKYYDSSGCSYSAVQYSRVSGVASELCFGRCSSAAACSDDGSIVVGTGSVPGDCGPSAARAFKWTVGGSAVEICAGSASDTSADGRVVVGVSGASGFRFETYPYGGSQLSALQPLPGFTNSSAQRVSSDGRLILGSSASGTVSRATLWVDGNVIDLVEYLAARGASFSDWSGISVTGLSRDGRAIVGSGFLKGQSRSWVARDFEPSISGVIPVSGPSTGGTVVTINGFNFSGTPVVRFGNVQAIGVKVVSPTKIIATTPAGLPGNCTISIDWSSTPDAFYYRPSCGTDANNDGVVDGTDLGILLSEWGGCQ